MANPDIANDIAEYNRRYVSSKTYNPTSNYYV